MCVCVCACVTCKSGSRCGSQGTSCRSSAPSSCSCLKKKVTRLSENTKTCRRLGLAFRRFGLTAMALTAISLLVQGLGGASALLFSTSRLSRPFCRRVCSVQLPSPTFCSASRRKKTHTRRHTHSGGVFQKDLQTSAGFSLHDFSNCFKFTFL